MGEMIFSVSQVSEYIKRIFEAEELLIGIKVSGEITNFKISGKAVYFDIKDENASLPCVCFDALIANEFKFGDKVVVKGRPNYYIKGGRLSFVVSKMEKFGKGELFEEYEKLKQKLTENGFFDPIHKQELPKYPKRIGVVTSRTGAVIKDIIRVAREKNRSTDIVLYPAKVQGVGAKEEIISGIETLDKMGLDIIIVARGGGSFEDYQPFNTEEVVKAVYRAQTPIISAIGHETDFSLIDFVADVRAGTPSIASDIAFYDEFEELNSMIKLLENAYRTTLNKQANVKEVIEEKIDNIYRLTKVKKENFFNLLTSSSGLMYPLLVNKINNKKASIDLINEKLEGLNPSKIMERGYFKITDTRGKTILSISGLNISDEIRVKLPDGEIDAKITEKRSK